MSGTINNPNNEMRNNYLQSSFSSQLNKQTCVRIMRKSELPIILKAETEQFIARNILPDCGRVPPNCLKAFMIKTAQKMGLENLIPNLKSLFKAKVGYEGYYLDGGKLFHIDFIDNSS